jgi:hypothetical protein
VFVVGDDGPDRRAVGAIGTEWAALIAGSEDVNAGGDDLGGAAMVDRQPDDLDTGKAPFDVDEQGRVGAVEAVDRLRGVADEEQVVAAGPQQVDELVLERVEVLGLVDEQVSEAPPNGVGELVVATQVADRVGEHVVEVDHAAATLERLERLVGGRATVDSGAGSPLRPARRRGIRGGVDAARRGPVDLGQERRDAAAVAGVDGVGEQAPPVGHHRQRAPFGVDPALLEHAEHHRVERARFDVFAQAEAQQAARISPAASRVNVKASVWRGSADSVAMR